MSEWPKGLARLFRTPAAALLFLLGLGGIVALVGIGGVYVASENPRFCITCHYMAPYYRQWQSSTHAGVSCVSCHPVRPRTVAASAIRYFTGTAEPRPRAEVADGSCLQEGCHPGVRQAGKATYKGKIHFDHATHLGQPRRGKELRCTSCHSQVVQGEHIAVTEATCFLCHFKGVAASQALGGCTQCHGTPTQSVQHEGFVFKHDSYLAIGVPCQQCHLQVAQGEGAVPKDRCFSCHVERVEHYGEVELIHSVHTSVHKVDCLRCHEPIRHGEIQMSRTFEQTCENCHKGLHSLQKDMYLGTAAAGLPDLPSRMFSAQVSCDGCHTRPVNLGVPSFAEASLEPERQSCVTCHGKGYDSMMDDWVRVMGQLVQEFGPEVERAESELRRLPAQRAAVLEARRLVETARRNYDFLRAGRGAHNVEYAVKLTRAAAGMLDQARTAMQPGYRAPVRSRLLGTPDGYCAPLCHTRLGLPDAVAFEGQRLPHAAHVAQAGVGCGVCHSVERHKETAVTRAGCASCHHQGKAGCAFCHPAQDGLYTGALSSWALEGKPDAMAAAGVACVDCHAPSAKLSLAAIEKTCVGCHESGYDQTMREWRAGSQAALEPAATLVRQVEEGLVRTEKPPEAEKLLAQAKAAVQLVAQGKGVHNYELSLSLLKRAEEKLQKALALLGAAPSPP